MRNLILGFLLAAPVIAFANLTTTIEATSTVGFFSGQNILKNPGFEAGGSTPRNWTSTGGTLTTSAFVNEVGRGSFALAWDSNGAGQNVSSDSITIPLGLKGRNGVVSCQFLCTLGTCTHTLNAVNTGVVIATANIPSSTTVYGRTTVNFPFPTSGTIAIRIASVAVNEPTITADDCVIGLAEGVNTQQVSQAQFVGQLRFDSTAGCTWARTSTTVGAFTADPDCPAITVMGAGAGYSFNTADTDLPQVVLTNAPPGEYLIMSTFKGDADTTPQQNYAISDGTTTAGLITQRNSGSQPSSTVIARFSYTTTATRTWAIHGASSTSDVNIANAPDSSIDSRTRFTIYRFPASTEIGYRADEMASAWSGFHDSDCTWDRTNAAFGDFAADATCTFTERTNVNFGTVTSALSGGNKLPGIVFTPQRAGVYFVCAQISSVGTLGDTHGYLLSDGVTTISSRALQVPVTSYRHNAPSLCGLYTAASTSPVTLKITGKTNGAQMSVSNAGAIGEDVISWTIFPVNQRLPAPLLVQSVTSSNLTGVERVERVTVAPCSVATCTISSQSGGISSVTRSGTGVYSVNFLAGVFSAAPTCVAQASGGNNITTRNCNANPTTSILSSVECWSGIITPSDQGFFLMCQGPR